MLIHPLLLNRQTRMRQLLLCACSRRVRFVPIARLKMTVPYKVLKTVRVGGEGFGTTSADPGGRRLDSPRGDAGDSGKSKRHRKCQRLKRDSHSDRKPGTGLKEWSPCSRKTFDRAGQSVLQSALQIFPALAMAMTRFVASFLYRLTPNDALTLSLRRH